MDSDFIGTVQKKQAEQKQKIEQDQRFNMLLAGNDSVQSAVLNAARAIVEANSANEPNVTIKNFPTDLATTSDIQALRQALEQNTVKTAETAKDGSEGLRTLLEQVLTKLEEVVEKDNQGDVTSALNSIEEELKDKDVTVTNLDDLGSFFYELQTAVESLDLSVNVEAPNVNIEAPDLSPINEIKSEVMAVKQAIEAIPATDNSPVERELKKAVAVLNKILARPQATSGGGGASVFQAGKDFNYIGIANDSSTQDTLTYKKDGSGGTTVRTLVVTYASGASKISDDLASLAYS